MIPWKMPPAALAYFGGSFALHLLWENAQAPFYEGYVSFGQHFLLCLQATVGDVGFMAIIYAALAAAHRDPYWIVDGASYRKPRTWVLAVLTGVLLGIGMEWWSVFIADRWQYAAAMPRVPMLGIGVTPVLQMILIPALVLVILYRSGRRAGVWL